MVCVSVVGVGGWVSTEGVSVVWEGMSGVGGCEWCVNGVGGCEWCGRV